MSRCRNEGNAQKKHTCLKSDINTDGEDGGLLDMKDTFCTGFQQIAAEWVCNPFKAIKCLHLAHMEKLHLISDIRQYGVHTIDIAVTGLGVNRASVVRR